MIKFKLMVFMLLIAGLSKVSYGDPYQGYVDNPTPLSAFNYIHQVSTHQRCVNCHGVMKDGVHRPLVGEDSHLHPMNISILHNLRLVAEGKKFVQAANTSQPFNCRGCHRDVNGSVPGAPPGAANDLMPGFVWHMPPPTMTLSRTLSATQLCEQLLDPGRNSFLAFRGGRDDLKTFKREFVHHVSDDPLIRWAWQPGPGRTPAPGTHAQLVEAMKLWTSAGAPCPEPS